MDGPTIVQFVDRIAANPTVRLDVCGAIWSLRKESDLSPPALDRAYAGSLLADGRPLTAAAYANRMLTLRLLLQNNATAEQAAGHIQNLAQELNRASNILRWQPGTVEPVFFRTLRADFSSIYWDPVEKRCQVDIPAEPFAYGVKESLAAQTVYVDPATPSGPLNANPFFEVNVANWTGSNGAAISRDTALFHQGVASMLVIPDGVTAAPQVVSEEFAVTPGSSVVVGGWLRTSAGGSGTRKIGLRWFDAAHGSLGASELSLTPTAATWTQYGPTTYTVPAGAVYARLSTSDPGTPAAANTWRVDEVTVGVIGASGANGCYADLVGIKGDVETPLVVSLPNGTTNAAVRRTTVFATRRRGTVANLPLLCQAEALTVGTDTTVQANNAAFSGNGSNSVRCTFATVAGTMTTRLSGPMTTLAPTVDLRGTYRVFARMRHTVSTDVINVQLQWGFTTLTANTAVTLLNGASANFAELHHYDLGLVQVPVGADAVDDGYSGIQMPATGPQVYVQAQRVSGSGNLDIDYLLFVPADDRLLLTKWPSSAVNQSVLDGTHEMTYDADVASGAMTLGVTEPSELSGGFPMLTPEVTNRLVFLRDAVAGDRSTDTITGSTVVTPSYYPRYLYVRGATS